MAKMSVNQLNYFPRWSFQLLLRPRHTMRQIAATRRRDRLLQQIASCDMWEFCPSDLSYEFKLVWIRATYRSDKISASSLAAPCVRIFDKSLRQNLNQSMRKYQLVSRHVKFKLVYISSRPKSMTCTEQVSYRNDLSQDQCRRGDLSPRGVAAICRIVCLGLYSRIFHDSHTTGDPQLAPRTTA